MTLSQLWAKMMRRTAVQCSPCTFRANALHEMWCGYLEGEA
jgi:hypothetical protein